MEIKKIKDLMSTEVTTVHPTDTLEFAAQQMKDLDVGMLPVCDGDHVKGMITDRDIVLRAVADGKSPEETEVQDIMSADAIYLFDDQNIEEAARLMEIKQIRRLIVLNHDKRLSGIISLGDISTKQSDCYLSGEILKGVSQKVNHGPSVL